MNIILDLKDLRYSRDFFELKPSRGILYFTIIILLVLTIAFTLATFREVDEVVNANAILRPVGTISSMRILSGGQILNKAYIHDMLVVKGDSLWEIDVQSEKLDLVSSKQLLQQFKQDECDMKILLETITNETNTALLINSPAWIISETWLGEHKRLKQQAEQIRTRLEREKVMPENMTSAQKIADLEAEYVSARTELENMRFEKLLSTTEKIKTLHQNEQTTEQHIADLERKIKDATVTAPITGRIDEIRRVNIGDYVMSGEHILNIIPQDAESIKAEIYIEPSHIARLKVGQKVYLRFPALPPSDFGQLEAFIRIIPADITLNDGNSPVFLVEAELVNSTLSAPNGEQIQLRSGMGAQARIQLSRRTVIRMILHKLDFIGKES